MKLLLNLLAAEICTLIGSGNLVSGVAEMDLLVSMDQPTDKDRHSDSF